MKSAGLFPIISLLILSACTTVEFVRRDFTPQKRGILRYTPTSNANREAQYREKVKDEARKFCEGDFTITKEYQALDESQSSVGVGTGFGIGAGSGIILGTSAPNRTMYNFVEFNCGHP